MSGPVICGIDQDNTASSAVFVARLLAVGFGLPLRFVHVVRAPPEIEDPAGVLAHLRRAAEASLGMDADAAVESGHPADRLVALPGEHRASFLVLGCHGPRSSLSGS